MWNNNTYLSLLFVSDSSQQKKVRKKGLNLTDEQEEDLVEWVKAHPILYDKSLRANKDVAKKRALWEEKAAELDVNGANIYLITYLPGLTCDFIATHYFELAL